jgi:acyl carrier protein
MDTGLAVRVACVWEQPWWGATNRGRAILVFSPQGLLFMDDIVQRIRQLLATRLKLAKAVDEISDDTPLFAPTGLGLDSIDALELVLGLEKEFGVVVEDRAVAIRVLASIRTIAEFIQSQGKG